MPLAMKLKLDEDFYVGKTRVRVSYIDNAHEFYLQVDGVAGEYYVTTENWSVLMPGVRVSAAVTQPLFSRVVKLLVDAPTVFITPGKAYRATHNLEGK